MALSNVTYTANGVTTEFVVTFSYIEEADITVTVDDVVVTGYTFNGSGNVVFNTAPLNGEVVYISRDSDVTQRVTTFVDGSELTEGALNDGGDQSLYLHQETRDLIDTINADNSTVIGRVAQNETDIASNDVDIAARVEGAASSTDNAVPKFDGATGKIVQNTGIIIDDSNNITGVANLSTTGHVDIDNSGTDDSVTVNRGGSGDAIVITKSGSGRDIVVNTNEFIVDDGDVTVSGDVSVGGDIAVTGTVDGRDVATDGTKLDTIEAAADVTDATNVDAAGAVMESDSTTASMSFVIDEDNMVSDSATKVPTQQSVKAYADTKALASDVSNVDNTSDANKPISTATQTALDLKQAELITTRGDTIIGDASGDSSRLAIGTAGQVLKSDGTDVAWGTNTAAPAFNTVTKTTTATLSISGEDNVICDASGGDFTITLPAVSGNSGLTYKITSKSTGTITIEGNASETIGGELNVRLASKGDSISITTDGISWFYISDNIVYAARYTSNSGQSIGTASLTDIKYEDIVEDTHNAYDISTGVYTIPISGWYQISAKYEVSMSLGTTELVQVLIEVDSSLVSWGSVGGSGSSNQYSPNVSEAIKLDEGQEVVIQGFSSIAASLAAGSAQNTFSIHRIK